MKVALTLVIMMWLVGFSYGEIIQASPNGGKENGGGALSGGAVQKIAITGRVLQVLDVGLLFSWGKGTYVLTGYPEFAKMADGDAVNCYVQKTDKTYKYTAVDGAERTARVYKYLNRRIGKR